MRYRLGVEELDQNLWIAWMFDLPGCFSNGQSRAEAISKAGGAIAAYHTWQGHNEPTLAFEDPFIDIHVTESYHVQSGDDGYKINSCFEDDRRELTAEDVMRASVLLEWTRADLMSIIDRIPDTKRAEEIVGEAHKSINGIIKHLGGAEWWYLDCMGLAFPKEQIPKDPIERLTKVRATLKSILPGLVGNTRSVVIQGEEWTSRKLVRRALWHERDHTGHIAKLIGVFRGTGPLILNV
jgi:predicted RNase H-like HicB family nuclease